MEETKRWFARVTSGDSVNAAAKNSGLPQATLNTRLSKGALTMEDVVSIASGYGRNPVAELVAMNHLTQEDVDAISSDRGLKAASDEAIVAEVWDRIKKGKGRDTFDKPLGDPTPDYPSLSVVPDIKAAKRNNGRRASVEGAEGSTP